MLAEMKNIAGECIKHPSRISVWSEAEGRYVCPERAAAVARVEAAPGTTNPLSTQPAASLSPTFKLVFVTAAVGTGLFLLLCISLHLITGGTPPPPMEKLIQGMFDLVKVGFGAIVGLLGGKALDQPARA